MDETMYDDVPDEDSDSNDLNDLDEVQANGGLRLDADSILDSLVPSSIDWRDTVRRHPVGSVVAVGLVGYLVGRTKGAAIMSGLTVALSTAMMRQLSDVFEGDFFEF